LCPSARRPSGRQARKAVPPRPSQGRTQDCNCRRDPKAAHTDHRRNEHRKHPGFLRPELEVQVAGLAEWVTGTQCAVFHRLVRRFGHLRQFTPVLLCTLALSPDARDIDVRCLEALRVLEMRTHSIAVSSNNQWRKKPWLGRNGHRLGMYQQHEVSLAIVKKGARPLAALRRWTTWSRARSFTWGSRSGTSSSAA
jgi:hypothetical protein